MFDKNRFTPYAGEKIGIRPAVNFKQATANMRLAEARSPFIGGSSGLSGQTVGPRVRGALNRLRNRIPSRLRLLNK